MKSQEIAKDIALLKSVLERCKEDFDTADGETEDCLVSTIRIVPWNKNYRVEIGVLYGLDALANVMSTAGRPIRVKDNPADEDGFYDAQFTFGNILFYEQRSL